MKLHPEIERITQNIIERSKPSRTVYLERLEKECGHEVNRKALGCSNLAHGFAACDADDKTRLTGLASANIAIVSAYNDMLSAHQPLRDYPEIIKQTLRQYRVTAQFAGGVPAMCDGVTQSQPGMELSLFSRDIIAQSTAIALSHNMFDAALYLGVCDKIVPGLLIGALHFGHLPAVFVPGGPMPSGISNSEKSRVRQEFAQGKVGKELLLKVESDSYHSPGTCTFYGTANTNQMLMEIMGLHLPGSSFVNANTPLREALTRRAAAQLLKLTAQQGDFLPVGKMIDEKSFVNAIIGLLATGGSSNHTIHLIAMARAAGIQLNWDDFHDLSEIIPLLTRMYPNGSADVNHFHALGGMPYVISELRDAGLVHDDVKTIMGEGLLRYTEMPQLDESESESVSWQPVTKPAQDNGIISPVNRPFDSHGGLNILTGNIGRSVIKTSALKKDHRYIKAPARVFNSQHELQQSFKQDELNQDFIAVVRYQGPKADGMPELHGLMPPLGALQDAGYHVAIVTDGRMSGASGKVPSAIHMVPEAVEGGVIAKIMDGDMIELDIDIGAVNLLIEESELASRQIDVPDRQHRRFGTGRELFASLRMQVGNAEQGATLYNLPGEEMA